MTRMRIGVVAVAVALFAVAVGIALGAGPLQDDMHDAFLRSSSQEQQSPQQQREQRALRQTASYDKDAVSALAPGLLAGRLQDRPVVVVALPSADKAQVDAVVADLEATEGSVTAQLQVGEDLINPSARTLLDTLSAGQVEEYDALDVPDDVDAYERVGLVLGRALLTGTDAGEPLDSAASGVFNGFTTAGLLEGEAPEKRASLAVIVAGDDTDGNTEGSADDSSGDDTGNGDGTARGSIIATLARTMANQGDGTVVVGPRSSAHEGGAVAAVRADSDAAAEVSTVDMLDTRMGQVATVLTLADQASGNVGHYGAVDAADGAVPR